MGFEFATAGRILFGPGVAAEAATAARNMGRTALVVAGLAPECCSSLVESLSRAGVAAILFRVDGEPALDLVRRGVAFARERNCDAVVAFGGGSAMDAGKAIAALLTNGGDVADYLEVIGAGKPLTCPSAPMIAIPTTAGTGSEVTRNAVLASPEHCVKVSLRSQYMLPRVAIVDPELTLDLPPAVTASTGLDALTQLVEPFVSVRANAMTDLFCVEGIRRASRALFRAFRNGGDLEARTGMALASLLGGLALANSGLGVVHGFAAPVGGMFPAPHGAVCAALLPHGMDMNVRALRARAPASEALRRYETVSRILTGRSDATAEDGIEWVRETCAALAIPPLREYGISSGDVPALADKAAQTSSMKGNPVRLTSDELREVLTRAL